MAKRDYSDFIKFAKKHKDLSRTEIYNQYRASGGKGRKTTLLGIMRDSFGIQKGENRKKAVKEIEVKEKAKPYRKPKPSQKVVKGEKRGYAKFDIKDGKQTHWIDKKSPAVKKLQENILKLYGRTSHINIQINMQVKNDGYTNLNNFSIIYPFDGKKNKSAKQLGNEIIDNMMVYYENLAKLYKKKDGLKNRMTGILETLRKDLKSSTNLNRDDLDNLFEMHGITINSYQLLGISDKPKM